MSVIGFTGVCLYSEDIQRLNQFRSLQNNVENFTSKQVVIGENYFFRLGTNGKFESDKYIVEIGQYITGFEGVKLNSDSRKIEETPMEIVNTLNLTKGVYSAFHYDKETKNLDIFADHTCSRPIFYYSDVNFAIFSSSIFEVIKILKSFKISFSLCTEASYMILSLGYLLEDFTLVKETKKLS